MTILLLLASLSLSTSIVHITSNMTPSTEKRRSITKHTTFQTSLLTPSSILTPSPQPTQQPPLQTTPNTMVITATTAGTSAASDVVSLPRLDDLVLHNIAQNYLVYPVFDHLPNEYINPILTLIKDPTSIDLSVACVFIEHDKYWEAARQQQRQKQTHRTHIENPHPGQTHKQLYLQQYIQTQLQEFKEGEEQQYRQLLRHLHAAAPYVHQLSLSQYPSHHCLDEFLSPCSHLHTLSVEYGYSSTHMAYDNRLLGMKMQDAQSLATLMAHTNSITTLCLTHNLVTDSHIDTLITGLQHNHTLTHMNLAHNMITDAGCVQLASTLLDTQRVRNRLTYLNIEDNRIGEKGGMALSISLSSPAYTQELMAVWGTEAEQGCAAAEDAYPAHLVLKCQPSLLTLCVSSNHLGVQASRALLRSSQTGGRCQQLEMIAVGMGTDNLEDVLNTIRYQERTSTYNTQEQQRSSNGGDFLHTLLIACNPLVTSYTRRVEEEKEQLRSSRQEQHPLVDGINNNAAETAGVLLISALKQNRHLLSLDVSRCGWTEKTMQQVQSIIAERVELDKYTKRKGMDVYREKTLAQ